LRTRAIPERLRGVITTRLYTHPCLPLPLPHHLSSLLIVKLMMPRDDSVLGFSPRCHKWTFALVTSFS